MSTTSAINGNHYEQLHQGRTNMYKSKVDVVLGAQWGDEGKGKVVDMLASEVDIVCRCQVSQIPKSKYFVKNQNEHQKTADNKQSSSYPCVKDTCRVRFVDADIVMQHLWCPRFNPHLQISQVDTLISHYYRLDRMLCFSVIVCMHVWTSSLVYASF